MKEFITSKIEKAIARESQISKSISLNSKALVSLDTDSKITTIVLIRSEIPKE